MLSQYSESRQLPTRSSSDRDGVSSEYVMMQKKPTFPTVCFNHNIRLGIVLMELRVKRCLLVTFYV